MKRQIAVCAASVLLISIAAVGGTSAYLSDQTNQINNPFHTGSLTPSISEDFEPPTDPNETFSKKIVSIRNPLNGTSVDAFVKAMLLPTFRGEGKTLMCSVGDPVGDAVPVIAPDGTRLSLLLSSDWTDHWIYRDGSFYYKRVVKPGETTPPLLLSVLLESPNPAVWDFLQVEVLADAIQAEAMEEKLPDAWGMKIILASDGSLTLSPI